MRVVLYRPSHQTFAHFLHPLPRSFQHLHVSLVHLSSGRCISPAAAGSRLKQITPGLEDAFLDETLVLESTDLEAAPPAALAGSTAAGWDLAAALPASYGPLGDDWTTSDDSDILAAAEQLTSSDQHSSRKIQSTDGSSWPGDAGLPMQNHLQQQLEAQPKSSEQQQSQQPLSLRESSAAASAALTPLLSTAAAAAASQESADVGNASSQAAAEEGHAVGDREQSLSTASSEAAVTAADGSFFASRAQLTQRLREEQLQRQRQYLLLKRRHNLYQYTLSEDGSSIVAAKRPGPRSALLQTEFPLAKKRPAEQEEDNNSSSTSSSSSDDSQPESMDGTDMLMLQQQQQQPPHQRLPLQQPQQPEQLLPMQIDEAVLGGLEQYPVSTSSNRTAQDSQLAAAAAAAVTAVGDGDPSRGLALSAFLYCCSRSKLLSLTWQLGLPPEALSFVSRVADADLVLHVKPRPRERHYQYDDLRAQAAAKGIPFIDLKVLSLQELQLYLLPVFRLYAGEVAPGELLRRRKKRRFTNKRRYTAIKLPAA